MIRLLAVQDSKKLAPIRNELKIVMHQIAELTDSLKHKATANFTDIANVNKNEASLQQFARGVNMPNQFYEVLKNATQPKITEDLRENPVMLYYNNC